MWYSEHILWYRLNWEKTILVFCNCYTLGEFINEAVCVLMCIAIPIVALTRSKSTWRIEGGIYRVGDIFMLTVFIPYVSDFKKHVILQQ